MKTSIVVRIGVATCLAFSVWHSAASQDSNVQNGCHGLHAGITAQLTEGYSDPSVMVGFLLLNDSEGTQDTAPESWQIVIDGRVLKDSGWIWETGRCQ